MEVLRAKTAGFCMGVSLALHRLDKALATYPQKAIRTLGPIIHNPQVLAEYEAKGVLCITSPDEAFPGDCVIIRAHGIPRHIEEQLRQRGCCIVDATCPKVKKAQLAIEKATQHADLLLFGEEEHPEVQGLVSYAHHQWCVFNKETDLDSLELNVEKSYVLAAQTTQDRHAFASIEAMLQARLPQLTVLATICDATRERQQEARQLAEQVDVMVVVGGKTSGNTRRLADIAAEKGIATYYVESVDELQAENFSEKMRVGLTAGASTPKSLIDTTHTWLCSL